MSFAESSDKLHRHLTFLSGRFSQQIVTSFQSLFRRHSAVSDCFVYLRKRNRRLDSGWNFTGEKSILVEKLGKSSREYFQSLGSVASRTATVNSRIGRTDIQSVPAESKALFYGNPEIFY